RLRSRQERESAEEDDRFLNLGGETKVRVKQPARPEEDKKFLSSLKSLTAELLPVKTATDKLAESEKILDRALKEGKISAENWARAIDRLNDSTQDARLPMVKFNKELAENLRLAKLGSDELEIENAVIAKRKELIEATEKLNEQQIESRLKLFKANQLLVREEKRIVSTLEALNKPIADLEKFDAILGRLIKKAPELETQLKRVRTELEILALQTSPAFADQMRATFLQIQLDAEVTSATMADFFGKAFKKMEDFIVEFVETGKFNMADLFNFIRSELIKLAVRKAITGPLSGALAGAFQTGGAGGPGIPNELTGESTQGTLAQFTSFLGSTFGGFQFAKGGQIEVGGSGGPDSQRFNLMTTPGETIAVFTPQQLSRLNQAVGMDDALKAIFSGATLTRAENLTDQKPMTLDEFLERESNIPGFRNGGSLVVGGQGGPDSQIVKLRATPGEEITVTKPGQESESREQRPITMIFNFPNADVDSFRRSEGQIMADFNRVMANQARRDN
ncbi:MAG: phage tail tape measure C-terminal domain-containing protein, partial [Candidatus Thorarchaeota archaeon]